jgi:hypothetical protein
VPTAIRGPWGGEAVGQSWVTKAENQNGAWSVTEGNSFEANTYLFTPSSDGTLTQSVDYDETKVTFARCP